ncbi:MAG: rhomboid family intramembrane serine protease [Haliangium ochraceum]
MDDSSERSSEQRGAPTIPDFDGAAVVRRAADRDRIEDWVLVLAALGIDHRAERQDDATFALVVPASQAPAALRALAANDDEARQGQAVAPAVPDRGTGTLGVVFALALLAFQYVTGLWESQPSSRWFTAGAADARLINAGQWWRAVTAMTLHADLMHVFGNAVASVIFVGTASRWLGAGVAAISILLAGTAANLLTAVVEKQDHVSVGASTATFAALGLVVGLQVVRRWRGGGAIRRRAWVAAGAGLALLAMLGVGAKADVFAHAFGLGWGIVAGIVAGTFLDRPRSAVGVKAAIAARAGTRQAVLAWLGQGALVLVALGAVAAAWARAFGRL